MQATVSVPGAVEAKEETTRRPACPVCCGPLVETRGAFRCARCHYTFCEGCGGAGGAPFVGDASEE
jgi:hypothetical protein